MTARTGTPRPPKGYRLPTFEESEAARDADNANPVQLFVYNYEPGDDDEEWRAQLMALIEHIRRLPAPATTGKRKKQRAVKPR